MERIFYSKRDWWLSAVAWLGIGVMLLSGVFMAAMFFVVSMVLVALGMFVVAGFVFWTWLRTFYLIKDGDLLIRSGPFRWSVRICDIEGIVPTRDALSSPAWSLDRLRIEHKGRWNGIMISPDAREEFLRSIAAADAGLFLDGDSVKRRQE